MHELLAGLRLQQRETLGYLLSSRKAFPLSVCDLGREVFEGEQRVPHYVPRTLKSAEELHQKLPDGFGLLAKYILVEFLQLTFLK